MTDDTSREKGLELRATDNRTTDSSPGPRRVCLSICVCCRDELEGFSGRVINVVMRCTNTGVYVCACARLCE